MGSRDMLFQDFSKTEVTLEDETHTVEKWCELRNIPIDRVYRRRQRLKTWVEAFAPVCKKKENPYRKFHNGQAKIALTLRSKQ